MCTTQTRPPEGISPRAPATPDGRQGQRPFKRLGRLAAWPFNPARLPWNWINRGAVGRGKVSSLGIQSFQSPKAVASETRGWSLRFASPDLKDNEEMVALAMAQDVVVVVMFAHEPSLATRRRIQWLRVQGIRL